jgi:two-component system chemotaxis response regulator CheY
MKGILIVDDSTTMRRMVMASLKGFKDVRFNEAGSGLEAIERLALGRVDLIILDLNMPDIHGLEVLRFVRSHPSFNSIPVVILTTRGDEASQSEAYSQGASLYLTKPFDPSVLARHARNLLESM